MPTRRQLIALGASAAVATVPGFAAATPRRRRVLRIAHLTDIHVQPERKAPEGMAKCLERAQTHKPDVIFIGGDMIMDSLAVDRARLDLQWDLFTSILKANTKRDVVYALGNHDVWGWGDLAKYEKEPLFGKRYALDRLGLEKPYRSFDRAGWHFVVLDSTHRLPGNGYVARLDDEQFEWLQGDLAAVPKDRPVLVLSHMPIFAVGPYLFGENEKTGNWQVPGAWMHIDARRIKDLFHRHPNVRACLSGHMHIVDHVEYLGVKYFCNGATSGGWWGGKWQEFEPGFAIVDLFNDGTVENRYYDYGWKASG
jgi:3',5'-cyclic AMP phosphodiesterase CpdA